MTQTSTLSSKVSQGPRRFEWAGAPVFDTVMELQGPSDELLVIEHG